jgi:hypothetical protein
MIGDIGAVLRKTPLFANLTEAELQALSEANLPEAIRARGAPVRRRRSLSGLFPVASGKIRIFKLSATGRE